MISLLAACSLMLVLYSSTAAEPNEEDRELAGSLRGVYRTMPEDAPSRYAVELIASRFWHSLELERLEGKIPASASQLDEARIRLKKIRDDLDRGKRWTAKPPKWMLPRFDVPPRIDGRWSAAEWRNALKISTEYPLDSTEPYAGSGSWYLGYDSRNLYIAAVFQEKAAETYAYSDTPGSKQPWDGDAVEIFILPDMRLHCYREIIVNAAGCAFTALHTKRRNEIYINCLPEDPGMFPAVSGTGPNGEWILETAIPFSELPGYFRGNAPRPGEELRLALLRTRGGQFFSVYPLLYSGHNIYNYATVYLK